MKSDRKDTDERNEKKRGRMIKKKERGEEYKRKEELDVKN